MLIENTRPCHVSFRQLHLQPGCNSVNEKAWEGLSKIGYEKAIKGMVEEGHLVIHDNEKPSIALVAKTYDIPLLEEWLTTAKGPLKGAIKKQLAIFQDEERVSNGN